MVLSTDCGWFRLETDGAVSRLPVDWLATQNAAWRRKHGIRLTLRPTRSGRYLVVRSGRVIWRSAGTYLNEYGGTAFGRGAFAFASYSRGVFLTDLAKPELLVARGKGLYPIGFTADGELLVSALHTILVVSRSGRVVRRYRYRRSSAYSLDESTDTLFFVSPDGTLISAHGSAAHRMRRVRARGTIRVLGRRLLAFSGRRHLTVLRRDGSLVARAGWRGAGLELDAGVSVSDDGRWFAYRLSNARPGARRGHATLYVLRAGEGRARAVYRQRFGQVGCGYGASLSWHGHSLLYRATDSQGVAETALLRSDGRVTRLTPLLRALPRIVPTTPGNAFWATSFST
jgi:hypothetical protein